MEWESTTRNSTTKLEATLDHCQLRDLGSLGNQFTWCNRQEEGKSISEKLDHFVANKEWQNLIHNWTVSHGWCPIQITLPFYYLQQPNQPSNNDRSYFGLKPCGLTLPSASRLLQLHGIRVWILPLILCYGEDSQVQRSTEDMEQRVIRLC